MNQIQVLTPFGKKTILGSEALNVELQRLLNPPGKDELTRDSRIFRVGDRILQTKNDYDLGDGVFNGDQGRVREIDYRNKEITLEMDGQTVRCPFSKADNLVHSYSMTIHRSQGSEFDCVVLPLSMQNYTMLKRNLLYTGITRGRRLVVCIGQRKALVAAVKNINYTPRVTNLAERLRMEAR
jgi:exodeoxyribonuclease V alpha subunit